ncbi:MAG: PAS domain S-box protein [Planctomyces sp.]|nr:PAS domain S-box protein [Planctomyces sp.]
MSAQQAGSTPLRSSTWCTRGAALIALVALLGWAVDSHLLKGWTAESVAMNPATALVLLAAAAGIELASRSALQRTARRTSLICGLVAAGMGLLKAVEYLTGWGLAFDRLFFSQSLASNQVAPNTALAFLTLGSAICLFHVRLGPIWVAEALAGTTLIGAFMAVLGYSYGLSSLYGFENYISMAMNTAAAFALLAFGLLAARPDRGLMSVATHAAAGKLIFGRLLPLGLGVTLAAGYLRLQGERAGWFGPELGLLLHIMFTIGAILATLFWTSWQLQQLDARREASARQAIASELRTRDLYENAPCGYHSLDAAGRIIEINATQLRWLGYGRGEMLGRPLSDYLAPSDRAAWSEHFDRIRESGAGREIEYALLRRDGSHLPALVSARMVDDVDGQPARAHVTVFDISERKQAEQRIRRLNEDLERRVADRTRELETLNRRLAEQIRENETFVYSVSHDLRSPLVNLQGFSHEIEAGCGSLRGLLADDRIPEDVREKSLRVLDDELQEAVEFIQAAVTRLGGIIDALLRLSRAGRVEYQQQAVDAGALVRRAVQASAASIASRGAEVVVSDLPVLWGDPTAIEQIFANLLGNAINYLDPARPGRIEIAAEPGACVRPGRAGRFQTCFVRDNGLGIPRAHGRRIFSAFQRVHPGAAPGEGMGLTLVKQIVERHGGDIWFESQEGAGTTFFVTLPAPEGIDDGRSDHGDERLSACPARGG